MRAPRLLALATLVFQGRAQERARRGPREEPTGAYDVVREDRRRPRTKYGDAHGPGLLLPDVAELEEDHQRQERKDEQRDRRALAEVAALEADLVGEGGEEVRGVHGTATRQDLHDVEV